MATSAVVIVVIMVITWLVSLARHDAGIVDPVWPLGFVAVAITGAIAGGGALATRMLLLALVGIWGLRLSAHLFRRNLGAGEEDFRYRAMRERRGERFWIISLFTVFLLQGVLMWVVSLPVQLAATSSTGVGWAVAGTVLWAVGLGFEAVGDAQLTRFKADPASRGQVLDTGLWRYTRHPNYFGDALVWWGIFVVAAGTGVGAWGVVGPLLMTVLLVKVSGAALLERDIAERRPGYAEYVRRTSGFIPRPPRRP